MRAGNWKLESRINRDFILIFSLKKVNFSSRLKNITHELGTLEWDTFNPDCLIRISNMVTFNVVLNPSFFGKSTEKSKTGVSKSLSFLYSNLKWRAKFQISRLLIRDYDWLKFIHFLGYKYKISY